MWIATKGLGMIRLGFVELLFIRAAYDFKNKIYLGCVLFYWSLENRIYIRVPPVFGMCMCIQCLISSIAITSWRSCNAVTPYTAF